MENKIKISDFAKLTGTTLKSIIYYHQIGLLQEPKRSPGGYRLYGPAELTRMRLIKRLKYLGLDLKRIKEIMGDIHNHRTLWEVLQSLRAELLSEKKSLEERVLKIERLLSEDMVCLDEDSLESPTFQKMAKILGTDQIENYARTCPEIYNQQQKLYGIIDDFQWSEYYHDAFRALAEFWNTHPEEYQIALDFGACIIGLDQLSEDDPEIEHLARETSEFIGSIPLLAELTQQFGLFQPLQRLRNEMIIDVLPPARKKYYQLYEQYINSEIGQQTGGKRKTKRR
ncbi:transcriptional regulator, MerR family [Desulfofarcimen acetoxidans DSM 771]|uniref:Transcriptional regulator, MerR family n=1 Tax=Desulfofarcimen acetoxidans (strain ATCC 49208 / DSM 771 / KCTC 5769 / VKM B-1644 / 5575) TaxID=485916 RepID=C8W132_DESAS|nr:MerR family transcriptional regulator [Desulfofarcimen acetoxidans]ACV63428.1 transcriptional regulator, MerR family [Desulfofarcimen acetoxidans DSM 771]